MSEQVKWLARWLDGLRIFPRALVAVYGYLLVHVAVWFMGLPDPSTTQAAFATAVLGAGAGFFGLLVGAGRKE